VWCRRRRRRQADVKKGRQTAGRVAFAEFCVRCEDPSLQQLHRVRGYLAGLPQVADSLNQ